MQTILVLAGVAILIVAACYSFVTHQQTSREITGITGQLESSAYITEQRKKQRFITIELFVIGAMFVFAGILIDAK